MPTPQELSTASSLGPFTASKAFPPAGNRNLHTVNSSSCSLKSCSLRRNHVRKNPQLELYEDGHVETILASAQIGRPAGHEGTGSPLIAARRSYPTRAAEIRHICGAIVVLPSPGDVLAGHPVKGSGDVPSLVGIARIFSKVRSAGSRGGAVNRREQHQIAAGIVYFSAADG